MYVKLNQDSITILANLQQLNESIFLDLSNYNGTIFVEWLNYNSSALDNWNKLWNEMEDLALVFNTTFEVNMKNMSTTWDSLDREMESSFGMFNSTFVADLSNMTNTWTEIKQDLGSLNRSLVMGLENYSESIFIDISEYNETIFRGLVAWSNAFQSSWNETLTKIEQRQDAESQELGQLNTTVTLLQGNANQGKLLQTQMITSSASLGLAASNTGTWYTYAPFTTTFIPKTANSLILLEAQPNVYFMRQTDTGDWCMLLTAHFLVNGAPAGPVFGYYNENYGTTINNYLIEPLPMAYSINNVDGTPIQLGLQIKGTSYSSCTLDATNGYYGIAGYGTNFLKILEYGS